MALDAPSVADNDQNKASRRGRFVSTARTVEPPRQRRSGLAALAVLLVVGGALVAGLLAVRMDARQPVLAAAHDIPVGTLISSEDLVEVNVASEGLRLIPADLAAQVLDGATYARVEIRQDTLVDENMLTRKAPFADDRAVVSVPLNPAITPAGELRSGDLVQVIRAGSKSGEEAVDITEGLVLSASAGAADDLGGAVSGSVSLLVPREAASAVVDAASAGSAGLALLERGLTVETELRSS